MIVEIDKIYGTERIIVEFGDMYYFGIANPLVKHIKCGVFIDDDYYMFRHKNKIYKVTRNHLNVQHMLEFETNVITLYYQVGNWYDAFTGALL